MSYNFFVAQSRAMTDLPNYETAREQTLPYLAYFQGNYTGNRAPLQIGHHFFGYEGGAYNEALKSFARRFAGCRKCVAWPMPGLQILWSGRIPIRWPRTAKPILRAPGRRH